MSSSSSTPRYQRAYSSNPCASMYSFSCCAEGWCSLHASRSSATYLPSLIRLLACSNARLFSFTAMAPRILVTRHADTSPAHHPPPSRRAAHVGSPPASPDREGCAPRGCVASAFLARRGNTRERVMTGARPADNVASVDVDERASHGARDISVINPPLVALALAIVFLVALLVALLVAVLLGG